MYKYRLQHVQSAVLRVESRDAHVRRLEAATAIHSMHGLGERDGHSRRRDRFCLTHD